MRCRRQCVMNNAPLTKSILKLYLRHAWKYPKYVVGLLTILPATLLIHQFLPPLIAAAVLDRLSRSDYVKGQLWQSFGTELLWYGILTFLGGVVAWRIIIILIWKLEAHVVQDLNQRFFAHLMRLSADFHANSFGGSLVSQANKLTGAYIRIADTTVFQVYTLILALIFTTVILLPRAPLFVVVLLQLMHLTSLRRFSSQSTYVSSMRLRPRRKTSLPDSWQI